jgi:hypothetical protein
VNDGQSAVEPEQSAKGIAGLLRERTLSREGRHMENQAACFAYRDLRWLFGQRQRLSHILGFLFLRGEEAPNAKQREAT